MLKIFANKGDAEAIPINADNLNYNFNELSNDMNELSDDIVETNETISGDVLYNTTGNNSLDITLNSNINDYKMYEVYYKIINTNNGETIGYGNTRELVGNPSIINIIIPSYFSDISLYGVRLYTSKMSILENKLTRSIGYNFTLTTNNDVIFNDTYNHIFITKVIAYK